MSCDNYFIIKLQFVKFTHKKFNVIKKKQKINFFFTNSYVLFSLNELYKYVT